MSRKSVGRIWQVLAGIFGGAILGAGHAWFFSHTAPDVPSLVYLIYILTGIVFGASLAFRTPSSSNQLDFCAITGACLGVFPALLLLLNSTDLLGLLNPFKIVGVLMVPVIGGMFAGGILDRIAEKLLLTPVTVEEEALDQ